MPFAFQVLRVLSGDALEPKALPADRCRPGEIGVLRQNDVNTQFWEANLKLYSNLARCTVLSEVKFGACKSLHRSVCGGERSDGRPF